MQKNMIQSLGYTGAVQYTGDNGTYWCYFNPDYKKL